MSYQVLPRPALRLEVSTHAVVSLPKSTPSVDPSKMIRDLSGVMALGVLLMHSAITGLTSKADGPALILVQAIVQSLGFAVRVPLFFLFSGWLFWRGAPTAGDYARKIARRSRTVLGPYLLWGGMAIASALLADVHGGKALPSIVDSLDRWLFYGNYFLWYLRHLFEIFLISPILGWTLAEKRRGVAFLAALGGWTILGPIPFAGGPLPTAHDVFFVALGGFAAIHGLQVPRFGLRTRRIAVPAYFAAVVATSLMPSLGESLSHRLFDLEAVAGVILVLGTYRPEWAIFRIPLVRAAQRYGVFVYLAQEPTMKFVRDALLDVVGRNTPGILFQFFLTPILAAAILLRAAAFLDRRAPKLYAFVTGGRGRKPEASAPARPNLVVVEGGLAEAPRERERIAA